jgi:hypothetical protein
VIIIIVILFFLSACGSRAEGTFPTSTSAPATGTKLPSTETQTPIPFTDTPSGPTQDPSVFGAIGVNEIQASALEPIANAIFSKILDQHIAAGTVQEYQVTSVTIFPGENGLLAEIIYNVRTGDRTWFTEGATETADGWFNNNCSRFDFFTTETEYQLKNRRLCN